MVGDLGLLRPTAKIAAAYVAAHKLEANDLAQLISSVAASLGDAVASPAKDGGVRPSLEPVRRTSAQVRKSIRAEGLISFEDGQIYRALKRHLRARGLTPDAYRVKWGLPPDYPMVCADYSAVRSAYARENGLGKVRRKPARTGKASKPGLTRTGPKRSEPRTMQAKSTRVKAQAGPRQTGTKAAAGKATSPSSKPKGGQARVNPAAGRATKGR